LTDLDVYLPGICEGSHAAFTGWMAGAELPLRRSLRPFAASVDTEALVQETLLRIWQVAARCNPDGKGNSLLRFAVRIARNLAVSGTRRQSAGGQVNPQPSPGPELPDPTPPPDPLLAARINECFSKLPDKPRLALMARLAAAGGAPDKELAEGLRMRQNTFLQNITRARRLLAECLRRFGIEVPA
jgi:RNA polymerase sigma-70 factor (ECF subfamily)